MAVCPKCNTCGSNWRYCKACGRYWCDKCDGKNPTNQCPFCGVFGEIEVKEPK
jgi:hypothetical protein